MDSLLLILYVGLFLISCVTLFCKLIKGGWSIFSYTFIYIIIYYTIIPIIDLVYDDSLLSLQDVYYTVYKSSPMLFMSFVINLTGIISFIIGYNYTQKSRYFIERSRYINLPNLRTSLAPYIALLFSLISLMSLILYIYGFGSFETAVNNTGLVRSNLIDASDRSSFSYLFRFINLSIISFLYVLYDGSFTKKINIVILLISSFVIVIDLGVISLSRGAIFAFILAIILAHLILKKKFFNFRLMFVAVIMLIILPYLKTFFSRDELSGAIVNPLESFMIEFGFPYYSIQHSIIEQYDNFYFSDFYYNLFGKILPSGLADVTKSTNYLNSQYMIGEYNQYVPVSLFGQGSYSCGVLGVFIITFLTGSLFKKIDSFFMNIILDKPRIAYLYTYIITLSLNWIRTGLPSNYFYLTSFLGFILFIMCLFKFKKQ